MNTTRDHYSPETYDFASDPSYQRRTGIPRGKGRWQHVEQKPLPHVPELPENPTEQQRAERDAVLAQWVETRFHNVSWEWIADSDPDSESKSESQSKSLAATDRERPPMLPLPRRSSKLPKVNLHRHEAQCSVCRHPDRQIIEDEFVNWASPRATAKDFGIDFRALYRHARVYNLIAARNRNIRGVLSLVLERAEHIATPTADAIIRGVKAFTRVNDDGEWIEPPSHVIFSSDGTDSHHSSNLPSQPDDVLGISPESDQISGKPRTPKLMSQAKAAKVRHAARIADDPIRIGVLSEGSRRPGQGRRSRSTDPASCAASATNIPQSFFTSHQSLATSHCFSKVRHAARIATPQLAENTHQRLRYPETHFAVHRSRKIKTKAKGKCPR